jgi:ferritin
MSAIKIIGKLNPKQYSEMLDHLTRKKIKNPFIKAENIVVDKKPEVEEREMFNRFNQANPRQDMAGGGMLVQPGFGGTRQGYKDDNLPDFITKTDTGYRVRSKKTKTNEAVSKSFKKLKDAKAFVREKNLVKSKTGREFPELVAKAQGVVDDYNNLLDKAIANNDLRNVKFFETYVKNRFKNTSDQNQILRQVYKKKLNYKDLTDARLTVADNLIAEIMKQEKIIAQDAIYERLGGKSGLKGKILKKINKGLKDQTKIKVDNAVAAIVEADEIIDDSFIKTVANRIGRTQFGSSRGEAAWRKALNKNKYYKDNKELLSYAFSAGGKSTRAPGMSLSEILDDAKYKKGGGVTFSGKQTQFSGLRRYIFDYAKTHWHRNNFDGNPEKSLIEFYDKNGKPIKWKAGSKLKLSEVQFKIPL